MNKTVRLFFGPHGDAWVFKNNDWMRAFEISDIILIEDAEPTDLAHKEVGWNDQAHSGMPTYHLFDDDFYGYLDNMLASTDKEIWLERCPFDLREDEAFDDAVKWTPSYPSDQILRGIWFVDLLKLYHKISVVIKLNWKRDSVFSTLVMKSCAAHDNVLVIRGSAHWHLVDKLVKEQLPRSVTVESLHPIEPWSEGLLDRLCSMTGLGCLPSVRDLITVLIISDIYFQKFRNEYCPWVLCPRDHKAFDELLAIEKELADKPFVTLVLDLLSRYVACRHKPYQLEAAKKDLQASRIETVQYADMKCKRILGNNAINTFKLYISTQNNYREFSTSKCQTTQIAGCYGSDETIALCQHLWSMFTNDARFAGMIDTTSSLITLDQTYFYLVTWTI